MSMADVLKKVDEGDMPGFLDSLIEEGKRALVTCAMVSLSRDLSEEHLDSDVPKGFEEAMNYSGVFVKEKDDGTSPACR